MYYLITWNAKYNRVGSILVVSKEMADIKKYSNWHVPCITNTTHCNSLFYYYYSVVVFCDICILRKTTPISVVGRCCKAVHSWKLLHGFITQIYFLHRVPAHGKIPKLGEVV
jgi:hypothetical protein